MEFSYRKLREGEWEIICNEEVVGRFTDLGPEYRPTFEAEYMYLTEEFHKWLKRNPVLPQ